MFSPNPIRHGLPPDDTALDALLETLPREPAVFLVDVGEEQTPYLSRTANLRQRLRRLLRPANIDSKLLNLRPVAREVRYWPVDSMLATSLLLWEQAKPHYPGRYRRMLGLRPLYFTALLTGNRFPRAVVTRRPKDPETAFGPYASRGEAETFLDRALSLFQLRRCDEELQPSPEHPGCIYGEMAMCLRPCQDTAVEPAYRDESRRFLAFVATGGESLRAEIEQQRDVASESLDFEAASRHHKQLAKLSASFATGSRMATHYARMDGIAVTPASAGQARLWPVWEGELQAPITVDAADVSGPALKQLLAHSRKTAVHHDDETKQEGLSVLVRWVHSSWCDGEWTPIEHPDKPPTRKLKNACLRAAGLQTAEASDERAATIEGGQVTSGTGNL